MGSFDHDQDESDGPTRDESDGPTLADRDDVIRFLERNEVPLPEGLTIEKVKSRGSWWAIDETSFSFRVERHPSGPFAGTLPGGQGVATPARWHVRKRYTYDLTTGEWDVSEQMREFDFDPWLLVDVEFERRPRKVAWDEAIERAREADDPEAILDERLAATESLYRMGFEVVPEDHLDEMLAVLETAFRERADMD